MKSLLTGIGVVVGLAAVGIGAGVYERVHASRGPEGAWNSSAIAASFAGVRVQQVDDANANVLFLYDLDNHSGADYTLTSSPSLVIMGRLKSTGSLSPEPQYHLASNVFLPSGNRTRITLEITQPFHWPAQVDTAAEVQFREMVTRTVSDLAGFVLFDPGTHYQVELPGAWPAAPSISSLLK